MALTLTHDKEKAVVSVAAGGEGGERGLFEYAYAPTYEVKLSRKPFFHPVRSLAGREVTGHPPVDHNWHRGIQMTCANLREAGAEQCQNFWGGPTYVKGKGYVQLDNNGSQRHDSWEALEAGKMDERLTWITSDGKSWLAERRVMGVEVGEGFWSLDFAMALKNVNAKQLLFGSPTTAGRENAGYGGLFWRGPASFKGKGGEILAGNGLEGVGVLGQRAPWLAFVGTDENGKDKSTLLFVDRPGNPDYPNKWFVRTEPFPIASFAFSFDREVPLDPGATMKLNHRIVIANGAWGRERIETYLQDAQLHD